MLDRSFCCLAGGSCEGAFNCWSWARLSGYRFSATDSRYPLRTFVWRKAVFQWPHWPWHWSHWLALARATGQSDWRTGYRTAYAPARGLGVDVSQCPGTPVTMFITTLSRFWTNSAPIKPPDEHLPTAVSAGHGYRNCYGAMGHKIRGPRECYGVAYDYWVASPDCSLHHPGWLTGCREPRIC